MINQIVEIFKDSLDKKGDSLILDSFKTKPGVYLKINNFEDKRNIEIMVHENKTDMIHISKDFGFTFTTLGQLDDSIMINEDYTWYRDRYFYSRILDTNRSLESPCKQIHSNNYLSFFIKPKSFNLLSKNGKIGKDYSYENLLDKYYGNKVNNNFNKKIINQYKEFVFKSSKTIFELVEKRIYNAFNLTIDNYIFVLFDKELEFYRTLNEVYLKNNLLTTSIEYENNGYGINLFNSAFGGKPFRKMLTIENNGGYFIDFNKAYYLDCFSKLLSTIPQSNIYIDIKKCKQISYEDLTNYDQYIFIKKQNNNGAIDIKEYEFISRFNHDINFKVKNLFNKEIKNKKNEIIYFNKNFDKKYELEDEINNAYFAKSLYREDLKQSSKLSNDLICIIKSCKNDIYDYFRKNKNKNTIGSIFDKYTLLAIMEKLNINSLNKKPYYTDLLNMFYLRVALHDFYFNDNISDIIENLSLENFDNIDDDIVFSYKCGKVINTLRDFYIFKYKTQNSNYINKFLKLKNSKDLIKLIVEESLNVSTLIKLDNTKFLRLLGEICNYDKEVDISKLSNYLLAGYIK